MATLMHCVNHPNTETYLRCNKCGDPICIKCAVQTPVGYRCPTCVSAQQKVFYADFRSVHYITAAAIALPLAFVAGWLIPSLGWYTIILGPLVGTGIAEAVRWAIRRRRGKYTWLVVCASIVVGALPLSLMALLRLVGATTAPNWIGPVSGGLMTLIWIIVYLAAAAGAAYARLRPGRRV